MSEKVKKDKLKQKIVNTARRIYFKRWAKRAWAIFASLKATVQICTVKITICRQSLLKQRGIIHTLVNSVLANDNNKTEDNLMFLELLSDFDNVSLQFIYQTIQQDDTHRNDEYFIYLITHKSFAPYCI